MTDETAQALRKLHRRYTTLEGAVESAVNGLRAHSRPGQKEREIAADLESALEGNEGVEADQSGLYAKYEVRKNDEPVEECFVLEPRDDAAARRTLETYAEQTDDEELAQDLREWLAAIEIERYTTETERGGRDV